MDDFRKAYFINPPNLSMIEKTRTAYIYYEKELNFCVQCMNNFYVFDPKACKGQRLTVNNQGYLFLSAASGEDANTGNIEELNIINYQSLCKKLIDLITKLIANNFCFLENECVFNKDNYQIYLKFPEMLIDIIINGLFGKLYGFIEIRYALKMLKLISNSAYFTELFVERNGMELLYSMLVGRENVYFFNSSTNNAFANMFDSSTACYNQQANSSIIKIAVLENLYKLITHKTAFNRFIENNEKNKDNQIFFMIKDFLKENEKENLQNQNVNMNNNQSSANASFNMGANAQADNQQNTINASNFSNSKSEAKSNKQEKDDFSKDEDNNNNNTKEKRKEKDRKSRKSKKKSKKDRRNSRSRSRSRSKSKSKSKTISRSKESHESDHSLGKKKSKNNLNTVGNLINVKANSSSNNLTSELNTAAAAVSPSVNVNVNTNTILKNGYQILLALLMQKKNNIIFNLIQKILSKVTFIVYLKELGHITELLVN